MENYANEHQLALSEMDLKSLDELWNKAKEMK
jgi:uncharacterized protein YabN with tetrapyrrole methylase and pyrophosphatase domain